MNKTTKPIWRAYTSREEPVEILRHESTYKNSRGDMRTINRTWEVDSGGLYESIHFKTKKAAIIWAEELIETFDRYRHSCSVAVLTGGEKPTTPVADHHVVERLDALAGKLYDDCEIALGGSL